MACLRVLCAGAIAFQSGDNCSPVRPVRGFFFARLRMTGAR
jgi:hypothetical protein